ncbi:AmmeMemoRadiSam system protein B [Candidatus Micrarchaeota archaeon]|nr:AmmeMemoRadiSam system protein B [Candidatus Micrarchaeota archaeon]
MTERNPSAAGTFYPAEKNKLREMVDEFLKNAEDFEIEGELKALIVPHAGYIYSGPVASVAYKLLKKKKSNAKNIFLLGPSHFDTFYGIAQSPHEKWLTPLGNIRAEQLPETDIIKNNESPHIREHSLEVQLPFLQTVLKPSFHIYALLTGRIMVGPFARQLNEHLDEESILIVSSDLSHYHPYEQAVRIDSAANKAIPALNSREIELSVEACGKDAILTAVSLAKLNRWKCTLLDYKNSGDTAGPKTQVVGYGAYAFYR